MSSSVSLTPRKSYVQQSPQLRTINRLAHMQFVVSELSTRNRQIPQKDASCWLILLAVKQALIPSTILAKDCIRARALWSIGRGDANQKHVHIPFRTSKLTQVLKSAFDVNNVQTCKTLVIACINPSILDVAHSKNTLRYAEMLKVPVPKVKPRPFDERIPTTWENSHVQDWISRNVSCGPVKVKVILTHRLVWKAKSEPTLIGTQREWTSVLPPARG
jgi:hypothetical protein